MATSTKAQPAGGLQGRAVLVTGGGTGIGRACALRAAADGAAVTICGRREEVLAKAAGQISAAAEASACGGSVQFVCADVTDEAQVAAAVARAGEATGALNACIANAGGGGAIAAYPQQQREEFLRVLHLNVLGTMLCVKHSAPRIAAAGGGAFVGMSSLAGHRTHRYFGAYCVAKAGVESMMKNCADEFGPQKVRFNTIRPGFIETEIMQGIPRESETYKSYLQNTPLGGVGKAEAVAALARFLIGDESNWITGATIDVDGGHHLRRGPDFSDFAAPAGDAK